MMEKILIVLPTYNEENILQKNVLKVRKFCQDNLRNFDWQILIADNGSTDKTPKLAQELSHEYSRIDYFHTSQKGRGAALKIAWNKNNYLADIYLYMDIDLATDLNHLPQLIASIIQEGYDLTIGSRLQKESKTERSFLREFISRFYNLLLKIFFGLKIKDYQCGFKAVNQKIVEKIVPLIKNNNWFFDTELIILSHKNNYKIKEIPVKWVEKRDKKRKSKVKIIKTAWEDIKGIIRLKLS